MRFSKERIFPNSKGNSKVTITVRFRLIDFYWLTYHVMYISNLCKHSIIQMLSYSKNLGLEAKNHQSLVSDFWIRDLKVMLYLIVK